MPGAPFQFIEALGACQVGKVWSGVDTQSNRLTVAVLDGTVASEARWREAFTQACNELTRQRGAFAYSDLTAAAPWVAWRAGDGPGAEAVFIALGMDYRPTPKPSAPGTLDPFAPPANAAPQPAPDRPWATQPVPQQASAPQQPGPQQQQFPAAQSPAQQLWAPQPWAPQPAGQIVFAPPTSVPPAAGQPTSAPAAVEPASPTEPTSAVPAGDPISAPPASGEPTSGPPASGAPTSAPPAPVSPASGTPVFGAPVLGAPVFGAPVLDTPVFGNGAMAPPETLGAAAPVPDAAGSRSDELNPFAVRPTPPPDLLGLPPFDPRESRIVPTPPSRRRTGLWIGIAAAIVVLLAGGGVVIWQGLGGPSKPAAVASTPPSVPGSAPLSTPAPVHPGQEPPVQAKWPVSWPKFQTTDRLRTYTGLDGLGFTVKVPLTWQCTPGGRAADYAEYECGISPGTDTQLGGDLVVRDCPKPCDAKVQTAMRKAEEAWSLQWQQVSPNATYAESSSLQVDGATRYGLVLVAYFRSGTDGDVDRQVVLRMTAPPSGAGQVRRVANYLHDTLIF
ncbi:hypothetical protein GCM10023322_28170 [Rugosimonospora acidiphila]|uniref:Uncharacterized protein n=1 Tax=Rugosimonospora acidiphila TaxID=556531 RepID=A0ABP9RRL4_9ACTN